MMKKIKQVPYINNSVCAGCSVCVESCPMECLCITEPKFYGDIHSVAQVDALKCIGCGICAKLCPIQAIEMVIA